MIGGIILIFVLYGCTMPLLDKIKAKHRIVSKKLLTKLFWYHYLLALIYYIVAMLGASDSKAYYTNAARTDTQWLDMYGTSTTFITFIGRPFANTLGFSYEMMMVLFAWLGYWGFVFFYIYFKENLKFSHKLLNMDVLTLVMFFPNMHFWTSSLGKGSLIFFGLGLCAYGISKIDTRKVTLLIGLLVVYHVRPHVFLFLCIGIIMGLFLGKSKAPAYQKVLVLTVAAVAVAVLYGKILAFAKLSEDNVMESFESFTSDRAGELAKADSGVDISNYPLPLKLFTFWFRPLFVDSPSFLGLAASAENLLYLLLAWKIINPRFLTFIVKASAAVKSSLVIFMSASIALCFALSNLGIIMRQKSMVMYFFFFVIISFLDEQKAAQIERKKKMQRRREGIASVSIQ